MDARALDGRESSEARGAPGSGLIETRSIDYVPPHERHGKVWHQGPLWFTGDFVLATLVVGFIGQALGLALVWSVLAVVLGTGSARCSWRSMPTRARSWACRR